MKFLITGATGNVGRHLVEQLAEAGHHVRALTRNPAKAKFPASVEVIQGDLTVPSTLEAALEGVTGLHLINFGGDDYAPLETGPEIMAMAEKAGVKRVTVLSGNNGALAQAVEASSLAWTHLAPVEFMSGAFDYAPSIQAESVVRIPFPNRQTAIVDEADIAAVGVAALTQDGHGGKTYTITGGEILTPRNMVRMIGEAIGRNIDIIELTEAEAREDWRAQGFPEDVIDFFVMVQGSTPEVGYTTSPAVQEVTGKTPRPFAQWAVKNADRFR